VGRGLHRSCRARPADRSLVAEDRSAGGVPGPDGTETPLVRAGSAAEGQSWTTASRSAHKTFTETAERSGYSLLISGCHQASSRAGRVGQTRSHPAPAPRFYDLPVSDTPLEAPCCSYSRLQ
jgi:hypothetical protein